MRLQEQLLEAASRASAFAAEHLRRHADWPVVEYLRSLRAPPEDSLQPRGRLWGAIAAEAMLHCVPATVARAIDELAADPITPTANHFGLDTLADSVQGTLLFALRPLPDGSRRRTVVVLGFGSVSLNNLTYPMGLLLYDMRQGAIGGLPQRVPVLPNRLKHWAVRAATPFDAAMVDRARARLGALRRSGDLTAFCERAADVALGEEFAAPSTLDLPTYRRQASHVNARLWERMFTQPREAPQLVHLEIEAVCTRLLESDLLDPDSLVHQLFFVPAIRETLLCSLDGARACWWRQRLRDRLRQGENQHGQGGTIFFWGMSAGGKRIPLTLEDSGSTPVLAGIDETGVRRSWDFSPRALVAALQQGELLPALFTCFAEIAFAHGLACVGGFYQVSYLPLIQRGICTALGSVPGNERAAGLVAGVPSEGFVTALQGIVRVVDDGSVLPAGPIEIAAAGGISQADLAALESLSVRDATLAAFTELFEHVAPDVRLPSGWVATLAAENGTSCSGLVRIAG